MPSTAELLDEIRALELPLGQFAVFGSGPMGIRGLRPMHDVDLIVAPALWEILARQYPVHDHEHGLKRIQIGNVEILSGWYPDVGGIADLIREAEIVDGIPLVRLKKVLEWKRAYGRPKDVADIELIEAFLARQP